MLVYLPYDEFGSFFGVFFGNMKNFIVGLVVKIVNGN